MHLRVIAAKTYSAGGIGWPINKISVEEPHAVQEKTLIKQILARSYGGIYAKKPNVGLLYEHFQVHQPPEVKLLTKSSVSAIDLIRSGIPKEYGENPFVIVAKTMADFGSVGKSPALPPLPCLAFNVNIGYYIADSRGAVFIFVLVIPEDLVSDVAAMIKKDPNFALKVYKTTFPALAAQTTFKLGSKKASVYTDPGKEVVSFEPMNEFNSEA